MFCPQCRSEFRSGIFWCANCEVNLVDVLPDLDPFATEHGMSKLLEGQDVDALLVGTLPSIREAQRILSDARVPSIIAGEQGGERNQHFGSFALMVAVSAHERARGYLGELWSESVKSEGLELADLEETTKCPACASDVPPDAEECPDCGLFIGNMAE